jgi:hypothetical protein
MYAFAPEKTPSLGGRNFCLAIYDFLRMHQQSAKQCSLCLVTLSAVRMSLSQEAPIQPLFYHHERLARL